MKILASFLLVVCLFLPMSKCSRDVLPVEQVESGKAFYEFYVVQDLEDIKSYLFAIPFVIPFIMVLLSLTGKGPMLVYEIFDVIYAILVLVELSLHAYFANLIWGGYIALIAAVVCLATSIYSSYLLLKEKRKHLH
jgi:hypothetical protein